MQKKVQNTTTWPARLALDFRSDPTQGQGSPRTLLTNQHLGPLRIQKALYPEGQECCHAIVVHPPGGIAGGDCLRIDPIMRDSGARLI